MDWKKPLCMKSASLQDRIVQGCLSVCLVGLLSGSSLAQDSRTLVGRVIDIDGPRLYTDRLKPSSWFQAYSGMSTYLSENFRTDKATQAVLEFVVGARAGIGKNTQVRIVSSRKLEKVVGSALRVDTGTFWAKFDKQDEEFEIQTSGGVIGIEGTELMVAVDELSLIHI